MDEQVSIVTKPRDYSDIAKFDLAKLQDPNELESFLAQPLTFIAETITGALAAGKTGTLVAGGRIVQALLKGRAFKQFGAEFKKLRDAGKIPGDFAEKRYGNQTWTELMTIIDEESPDEDRLDALKAMFYEVNRTNASDGERIAAYHLWQIAKELSSGEILVLRTLAEAPGSAAIQSGGTQILNFVAEQIGHGIDGLVGLHYKKLEALNLVLPDHRTPVMRSPNEHLTPMGKKLCENIRNYQSATRDGEVN